MLELQGPPMTPTEREKGWQKIETAPKDGTPILVTTPGSLDMDVVVFADWRDRGGWFNGDTTFEPDEFTHWMPLPEPPPADK